MDNNLVERAESAASRDTAYHEQLYSQHYKIGEFAAMTGMSTSRVRFYERAGLFESRREENGYRYYTAHDAFRANAFRVLLQYGYSVDDAIRMLDAPQDTEELIQALSEQLASLERQHEQIHRRMRRIESSLEVLSLQQSKRFSLVDEPDWLYVPASQRDDFALASANAPAIAAFYDQMSVTRCARVLARDDLLGDAATVEPSYIIALPETEEAVLADADAAGVRTIALGKCLRYCRRIDRARSLCRESFEEMFDWMAGHGYRLRGDVLLVPQFFNLDAHGEDIELLFVPLE